MSAITLRGVTKHFGGTAVVRDLNLEIDDGEFLVLVGPSGCGKTTTLRFRMVAGLESIDSGELLIGGEAVQDRPAKDRDIAMVFQNYGLYPHMTVAKNLGFGLRMRGVGPKAVEEKVATVATELGLTELLERKPAQLSGGQRQRVAMGRAIAREPVAYLMDEPLSNLDAKLRVAMRASLKQLHAKLRTTTVYVTHDQTEAMTLGDRVAVLDAGVLQQCSSPKDLYLHPANLFVAQFIGSPAMNLARGSLMSDGSLELELSGAGRLRLSTLYLERNPALQRSSDHAIIVGLRPSDFLLEPPAGQGEAFLSFPVVPAVVEDLGNELHVLFRRPASDSASADDVLVSGLAAENGNGPASTGEALWTAVLPGHSDINLGEERSLYVAAESLYVFNAETQQAIAHPVRQSEVRVPATTAG